MPKTTSRVWFTVKVIASLIVLVAVVGLMSGWFNHKVEPGRIPAAVEPPLHVERLAVSLTTLPRVTPATGSIRAVHEATVASRMLARVKAVHVKAGQSVAEGDVLVELDATDVAARIREAQANLDAAEARLAQAQSDLAKVEKLTAASAATVREREDAQRAAKVAAAERDARRQALATAQAQTDYAVVRAPIAGVVIDKQVEVGDLAQPGKPLVTLYDPKRLQLIASVPERLAVGLRVGQNVGVEVDALDLRCQAAISEIVPQSAVASRAMLVKVTGPCPPGVYSGMFGRILVPHGDEQVMLVPQSAVRHVGQLAMVQVVPEGYNAHKGPALRQVYVRLGRMFGDQVEVLAGLEVGQTINAQFAQASVSP